MVGGDRWAAAVESEGAVGGRRCGLGRLGPCLAQAGYVVFLEPGILEEGVADVNGRFIDTWVGKGYAAVKSSDETVLEWSRSKD